MSVEEKREKIKEANKQGNGYIALLNQFLVFKAGKVVDTPENRTTLDDIFDIYATDNDLGYCPDCDQRMSDEPQRDESRN